MDKKEKFHIKSFGEYRGIRAEILGNSRFSFEGCTGIIKYEDSFIKIRTAKMNVCIKGRNLKISCMNRELLVIEGYILSVEYSS